MAEHAPHGPEQFSAFSNGHLVGLPGANGEVEWYLDGRLAFRETGRVFRSLPANPGNGSRREPFREIGIADIWMNFYHGGVTQNSYARTFFVAGLVVAEQRVGPMKI